MLEGGEQAPASGSGEPALTKQLFFIKDSLLLCKNDLQKFVLRGAVWKSGI
jgi:hypothetical protein